MVVTFRIFPPDRNASARLGSPILLNELSGAVLSGDRFDQTRGTICGRVASTLLLILNT